MRQQDDRPLVALLAILAVLLVFSVAVGMTTSSADSVNRGPEAQHPAG